eukprot:g18007.t1
MCDVHSPSPINTWLTLRAPPLWQWQSDAVLEGRSATLLRGTTHDLPISSDARGQARQCVNFNTVGTCCHDRSVQLVAPLESSRVYGLQAEIRVPGAVERSQIWSVELQGSTPEEGASVFDKNYEAVVGQFDLEIPMVAWSPDTLPIVIVGFELFAEASARLLLLLPFGLWVPGRCEQHLRLQDIVSMSYVKWECSQRCVPDTAKPKDSKEASEIAESGFVPTAPEKSGSVPVSATPSPNSEA